MIKKNYKKGIKGSEYLEKRSLDLETSSVSPSESAYSLIENGY